MWKQIRLLAGLTLCNTLGFNEARFGKDPKKKKRLIGMAVAFAFVGLMIMFYIGAMSAGLCLLGMAQIIPAYLAAITSLVILFFTMFKAGSILFNMQSYERVVVLPVKPAAIVISRFLTMDLFNILMTALVLLPGAVVCGIMSHPSGMFYLSMALGVFLLPLLPMTLATILGAGILAVSSRMRHKNLVNILLSFLMMLAILSASTIFSLKSSSLDEAMLSNLSAALYLQIGRLYPPALLFSQAAKGSFGSLALLAGISAGIFAVFSVLVQHWFLSICTALHSTVSHRNFTMEQLNGSSPCRALYRKELKRYFSSSIYVLNTAIGYVIMLLCAVGIAIFGIDKLGSYLGVGGMDYFLPLLPFVLAFFCVISPSTTSAISMEGKQWWIIRSLPLNSKTVFDSKILVTLTVALPAYALSELLMLIRLPLDLLSALNLILLPLSYILLTAVLGITVNARIPNFTWDSETTVVKQSNAVLVSMLIGFVIVAIPGALTAALPAAKNIIGLGSVVVFGIATAVLYNRNNRLELRSIG